MALKAVCLLLAASGIVAAAELPRPASAELCGDCHRAIHEGWKRSAHARAMTSRLFQDALKLAESELGVSVRRICLSCHSPMSLRLGDLGLKRKVSWEGVSCDHCHSVESVRKEGANFVAVVNVSDVKSGPSRDAASTAHRTVYSEVHRNSEICAPCHQYRNKLGLDVLTTYSEWLESSAAKQGRQCQDCHMYRVRGDVVDPRIKRVEATQINLHEMPGAHSLAQLNKAVRAWLDVERADDELVVKLRVANRTGAHFVPTGSPLRQLIIELKVNPYEGATRHETLRYRRVVADSSGKEIRREHLVFVRGAKVLSDSRLAPSETRTETFRFPIPRNVKVDVEAALWYYYSPLETLEARKVKFHTVSKFVP